MQISSFEEENFFRPIDEDRIQYFLIGARPESIGYEIPDIFVSQWLNSISSMPKSIVQILSPFNWHLASTENFISPHINLGILFDDYSLEKYDFLCKISCKILVIFLNSRNEEMFQKIESLERFFLVTSDDPIICSKLKKSKILQSKTFLDQETLFEKISSFAVDELNISSEILNDLKQQKLEQVEEFFEAVNFKEDPNFIPARVNTANICQMLSLDQPGFLNFQAVEHEKRSESLVKTSIALGVLSIRLRVYKQENLVGNFRPPTVILAYPFFNPDYKQQSKKSLHKTNDNIDAKKIFQYLRFIEQDTNTYNYIVNLESQASETLDKVLNQALISAITVKQNYALYLDFIGYLHSTFELSPYIRVPIRGASLNKYVSRLSPAQYRSNRDERALIKNIAEIGKALHTNLPPEIVSFLDRHSDSIFTISDLPIEWLLIRDVPLAFLCDVCRVPETISTSLFSQFNINCRQSFQIQENILERTLVVCGALPEDLIFKTYQQQTFLHKANNLSYKTAHIQSKKDFFDIVNKVRPNVLIIDSHGNFDNQSEGSYIRLGNEKLMGKDIVEHLPQIPLVILSCCWGAPIYGNSNTIAQAFFEKGSFSVLSTFIPISIRKGFLLYFRLLNNLSYAAEHGIHESWSNFISHNIRTSYFDDLLDMVFNKFGTNVLDEDKYKKLRSKWGAKSMYRDARHAAYQEVREVILECINSHSKLKVERLLKNSNPIPEFMLYTHLGRGDLIKFDSWIIKNQPDVKSTFSSVPFKPPAPPI
jgi:CHAT domain